jgi:hypothetical protein
VKPFRVLLVLEEALGPGLTSPGERRRQLQTVVASIVLVVSVQGFTPSNLNPAVFGNILLGAACEPVPLDESATLWSVESQDATCQPVNLPNGVRVMLFKDSEIELNVSTYTGKLKRGEVYVETYSLPFEITNLNHLVDPDLSVVIGLQNDFEELFVIRSIEGDSAVYACASEKATCSHRQMYIVPQGELLALKKDGSWYARQDQTGVWTYPKSGCSTAGHSGEGIFLLGLILFALIMASRRRM